MSIVERVFCLPHSFPDLPWRLDCTLRRRAKPVLVELLAKRTNKVVCKAQHRRLARSALQCSQLEANVACSQSAIRFCEVVWNLSLVFQFPDAGSCLASNSLLVGFVKCLAVRE